MITQKNDRVSQDTSRNSTENHSIPDKNTTSKYKSSNRSSAEISSRKTILDISNKSFCSACNQPITGQVIYFLTIILI